VAWFNCNWLSFGKTQVLQKRWNCCVDLSICGVSDEERNIIDLPEHEIPETRQFIIPLAIGMVVGIVAVIFHYKHWPYTLLLLLVAWFFLVLHFMLKIVFNWKIHPWQCLRDLSHIVIVSAVLSRFIQFEYSFWLLGAGLAIYFSTFIRRLLA
jgi:hypothetical protein